MSKILTDNQYYSQIANIIREQNKTINTYTPPQMVSALKDLFYEEVEGVPPITFQGIGENLLDYRIDGASGGVGDRTKNLCPYNKVNNSIIAHVESGKTYSFSLFASFLIGFNLMKRNASSQSTSSVATKYNSEGNVSATFTADEDFDLFVNGFSLISGKTFLESVSNFQLEESSTVTDYEPYGYKVPVVVNGKNLLQNNATTQTKNGVTFTVNEDKSISCNGTASGNAFFKIGDIQLKKNSIMSGCPEDGGNNSYIMRLYNNGSILKTDSGDGVLINSEIQNGYAEIRIAAGYTCDNLTFYPMIRLAEIEDNTYEPYIEETTNIYLDEPISQNESISLSDTEVDIPTIEGTNTLSINTTVQPSNVYIQAPKDSIEATQIANRLEEI